MGGADIEAVALLERPELSAWPQFLIRAELNQQRGRALVACIDKRLLGWCCARSFGDEAELLKIGVQRQHRRLAIGTELLMVLEERLLESGVERIFLDVRSKNDTALAFYQRSGFTVIHRRINYFNKPRDDGFVLRKFLC
jgi:ribosomal-protein-alanine N-acetyltransferase